jgi:hypothetical protein
VDEELCGFIVAGEIDGDSFTDAVDAVDAGSRENLGDLRGWRLEGLRLVAGPDGEDSLAVDALVDAVGDGFDLGKLGHAFSSIGVAFLGQVFDSTRSAGELIAILAAR